ncbi:MAG: type II secretion system protein [Clostridia bacterium]
MKKIRKKRLGKAGFTLIESIVAATLLAVFMGSIVGLMPMFSNIFLKVTSVNRCERIVNVIFDTINTEMILTESAGIRTDASSVGKSDPDVNAGAAIRYKARGYFMNMTLVSKVGKDPTNKYLKIAYEPIQILDTNGKPIVDSLGNPTYVPLPNDIAYGEDFYMGSSISDILFENVPTNPRLVKLTLSIEYEKHTYISTRVFELMGLVAAPPKP